MDCSTRAIFSVCALAFGFELLDPLGHLLYG
jgi:hypothetical protein